MGCKKNLVWVWFSNSNMQKKGQTSNCRRSLVSIFRYLLNVHIGLLAVVSKTDVQNQILSSSNKSKTTYLAKVGKNVHSTLLVQTKQSWKHSDVSTSPLMDAKTHPNQSTSQTLSRLPATREAPTPCPKNISISGAKNEPKTSPLYLLVLVMTIFPFLFCWWKRSRVSKACNRGASRLGEAGRGHASDAKRIGTRTKRGLRGLETI